MIPVKQTKRGGPDAPPDERGDCFDACLASVLEVGLDECHVPHEDEWWDHAVAVARRHGHALVLAYTNTTTNPNPSPATPEQVGEWFGDVYWLAAVPSRTLDSQADGSPVGHVVVMRGPEVAHDPGIGVNPYPAGEPLPEGTQLLDAMLLLPLADEASRTLRREGWRPRLAFVEHLLATTLAEHDSVTASVHELTIGEVRALEDARDEVRAMLDGSTPTPFGRELAMLVRDATVGLISPYDASTSPAEGERALERLNVILRRGVDAVPTGLVHLDAESFAVIESWFAAMAGEGFDEASDHELLERLRREAGA